MSVPKRHVFANKTASTLGDRISAVVIPATLWHQTRGNRTCTTSFFIMIKPSKIFALNQDLATMSTNVNYTRIVADCVSACASTNGEATLVNALTATV